MKINETLLIKARLLSFFMKTGIVIFENKSEFLINTLFFMLITLLW